MIAAVLAGGKNSRFPRPKAFMDAGGRPLIERTLNALRMAAGPTVISANEPELYFRLGVPLIGDALVSRGPASGIFSVLLATGADAVFVAACDMPHLNTELIKLIIRARGRDASVPVFDGKPEPLLAVYSRSSMGALEGAVHEGRGSMRHILGTLDVNYIQEDDIRRIDPAGMTFTNINTPEDYERVFPRRACPKGKARGGPSPGHKRRERCSA